MYKIIIFGTGSAYLEIKNKLNWCDIDIIAFSDNNSEKWNCKFENKKVINPLEINKYEFDFILICSSYAGEITKQLKKYKIDKHKIISIYDIKSSSIESQDVYKIINCNSLLFEKIENTMRTINSKVERMLIMSAQENIERIKKYNNVDRVSDIEFKVFSQWGEDGIIQYLINKIPIENEIFIEFGVENYTESNTRFLLINNNWSGLIIDGSKSNINYIKNDEIYWKYDLIAIDCFINRDNINKIILENKINGDIGILSVDIDGNDYWVLEKIDCISPRILICEYNSIFGAEKEVSIPYEENFYRTEKHYSNLYYGASFKAICKLAESKGYKFICSNTSGNNLFFVRKDLSQYINININGYMESKFSEGRNIRNQLSFIRGDERLNQIKDEYLFDFEKNEVRKIEDIYNL